MKLSDVKKHTTARMNLHGVELLFFADWLVTNLFTDGVIETIRFLSFVSAVSTIRMSNRVSSQIAKLLPSIC